MAKRGEKVNLNPLTPARSRAEWEAQGWASEPEPLTAAPRLEAAISIRFDPDGAALLRRAARLSGLTRSEFVRRSTLEAAKKKIDDTPLAISLRVRPQPATATLTVSRNHVVAQNARPATTTGRSARTEFVVAE